MGIRIVHCEVRVGTVLTDATSVVLSDPSGTFGVKRNDTGEAVVAAGTAMTRVSTGIYEYTFTEPAEGLSYTAWVEIDYQGAVYHRKYDLEAIPESSAATQTYTSLRVALADFLGLGRNSEGTGSDWSDETEHRLRDIISSGYFQFLYPPILPGEKASHRWSFFRTVYSFSTAAGEHLVDMPSNFGSIVGDIHYDTNTDVSRIIRQVSPGFIDRQRSINSAEGRPVYFALRPKSVAETSQQVTECMLYPTPDAAYSLIAYYDVRVEDLSESNPYPLGGQAHAETLLQSCRDIAAQRYKDQPAGPEHDLFLQRLQASVEFDRRNSPAFLGYNNSRDGAFCISRHGSDFRCTLKHNLGGG